MRELDVARDCVIVEREREIERERDRVGGREMERAGERWRIRVIERERLRETAKYHIYIYIQADFNPGLPNIGGILNEHRHILFLDKELCKVISRS